MSRGAGGGEHELPGGPMISESGVRMWLCCVCDNVKFVEEYMWESHLQSKAHKKNTDYFFEQKRLRSSEAEIRSRFPFLESQQDDYYGFHFKCTMCNKLVFDEGTAESHANSKGHMQRESLRSEMDAPRRRPQAPRPGRGERGRGGGRAHNRRESDFTERSYNEPAVERPAPAAPPSVADDDDGYGSDDDYVNEDAGAGIRVEDFDFDRCADEQFTTAQRFCPEKQDYEPLDHGMMVEGRVPVNEPAPGQTSMECPICPYGTPPMKDFQSWVLHWRSSGHQQEIARLRSTYTAFWVILRARGYHYYYDVLQHRWAFRQPKQQYEQREEEVASTRPRLAPY